MIPEKLLPAFQGVFPAALSTMDNDGNPNISFISQVFFVDTRHVAISNQFMSKTMRNILANGKATVNVIMPENFKSYYLYLKHVESLTSGQVFDDMSMQLEAIASVTGMSDVFKLRSSEIFEVYEIVEIP